MSTFLFLIPILGYFVLLYKIAKSSSLPQADTGDESYFLAGRGVGSFAAVISVIATETSVATIVVFPSVGMAGGYTLFWLLPGYILGRTIVATYYLKKLYEMKTISLYDSISGGGGASRGILSVAYLLAKFISSGVRFFLGAFALDQLFSGGVPLWLLLITVVVGIYSLVGGLRAVVSTDQLQGWIILFMGALFIVLLLIDGNLSHLTLPGWIDWNFEPGNARNSLALLSGGMILSIGTHGADQDMIQRILGTKSLQVARRSLIYSGLGASLVILLYLTVGILLTTVYSGNLDPKSPLVDYVAKVNHPLLSGLFAVLLIAAAMSTLDSAIHSTGAVWKGLFHSRLSGRLWSLLSLLILPGFAFACIEIEKYYKDFLGLAMGSMNYVNGGLIGILTHYTIYPHRSRAPSIILGLLSGFVITVFFTWMTETPLAWPWIVSLSSGGAFLAAFAGGLYSILFQKK